MIRLRYGRPAFCKCYSPMFQSRCLPRNMISEIGRFLKHSAQISLLKSHHFQQTLRYFPPWFVVTGTAPSAPMQDLDQAFAHQEAPHFIQTNARSQSPTCKAVIDAQQKKAIKIGCPLKRQPTKNFQLGIVNAEANHLRRTAASSIALTSLS